MGLSRAGYWLEDRISQFVLWRIQASDGAGPSRRLTAGGLARAYSVTDVDLVADPKVGGAVFLVVPTEPAQIMWAGPCGSGGSCGTPPPTPVLTLEAGERPRLIATDGDALFWIAAYGDSGTEVTGTRKVRRVGLTRDRRADGEPREVLGAGAWGALALDEDYVYLGEHDQVVRVPR